MALKVLRKSSFFSFKTTVLCEQQMHCNEKLELSGYIFKTNKLINFVLFTINEHTHTQFYSLNWKTLNLNLRLNLTLK